MSTEITTAFVKQYGANVYHLSQQKGSLLRNAVRTETIQGEERFFDQIGKAVAQRRTTRHADSPQMDTPHSRRMVVPFAYDIGDLVDKPDKIRTLNDPTNEYSVAFQWALGRSMDDEIIAAASATAKTGATGSTDVAHPNSQKIASVSGAAGSALNVQALRRADKKFGEAEVDVMLERYIAYSAHQKENLLGQTEVTSSDYATVKALVTGQVDTFMGFKFIATERLASQSGSLSFDTSTGAVGSGGGDSSGYEKVLAWVKPGLLLAIGQDINARIAERADKSFSVYAYASMDVGATRMEEEQVVEIHCVQT